ncbi:MAG: hypothetical protein OEM04_08925 [Flavobacteriaceae bacterium]|nr:hypothetical protein [Flavobacteriaceae bacterium]
MKKSIIMLAFLATMQMLYAQETSQVLSEGDIIIMGSPIGSEYQHLDFPRKNTIIKRGAIANFNNLVGEQLVVESISVNKNRITEAVLKRKNGLNFFRFYPSVTADIEKALAAGEISIID